MFLTSPLFANPVPAALLQPGGRSWRAVELAVRLPWFIVTLVQRESEGEFLTDLLISREDDLRALIVARNNDVSALQYVEPPADNNEARWKTRSVGRVWLATSGSDEALIYEDQYGEFTSRMAARNAAAYSSRRLLLDL